MLIRSLSLILALLMILPAPSIVGATVYWASSTGNNAAVCGTISSVGTSSAPGSDPGSYGTIGRAATCASAAGDIVNIKAGTYTSGNDRIGSSAIPASGTSTSNYTYIQGNPGGAVPQINLSNWLTFDEQSGTNRNYVVIQDVSVSGSGGADGGGAELAVEGIGILIQRVTITSSYNMNIASFTPTSASANNTGLTVQNSSLQGAGVGDGCGYALYSNAPNTTFQNNEVFGGKCGGLQIYSDEYAVDNAVVRNNYFHDIAKATQVSVLNLCFGVAVNGANALVYNNIIDGAGCAGGGAGDGISAGYRATNVLLAYNNTVVNWNGYGINYGLFATTSGNEAKNNILLNNASGTIGNASANGSSITSTTNRTTGAVTDCQTSLSDPHQIVASPCIDAGTTVAAVTDDYFGTARPQGSLYDIGPGESIVVASSNSSFTRGGKGMNGRMR